MRVNKTNGLLFLKKWVVDYHTLPSSYQSRVLFPQQPLFKKTLTAFLSEFLSSLTFDDGIHSSFIQAFQSLD